jgi:hypothetical protein
MAAAPRMAKANLWTMMERKGYILGGAVLFHKPCGHTCRRRLQYQAPLNLSHSGVTSGADTQPVRYAINNVCTLARGYVGRLKPPASGWLLSRVPGWLEAPA